MAAVAAAACGQAVAKHGNRAVSSFCGAADFFAQLGYPLTLPPRRAEELLRDTAFADGRVKAKLETVIARAKELSEG